MVNSFSHLRTPVVIVFTVLFSANVFQFPAKSFAQTAAPQITNIRSTTNSVPVYGKYELKFDLNTVSQYPFLQYDETPPSGVVAKQGVSVDAIFSANGKTWKQPAFYMTETVQKGTGSSMYFEETNKKYWVVRFAPTETGTFQINLTAKDSSGTATTSAGSFVATTALSKGFVQVSKNDSRYFEYSNGELFFPLGPANNVANDYTKFKDTGINIERPWMGGLGIYSTNWARWKSSAESHGNEGIATRLNWKEKYPSHDLSYELVYPQGYQMWLTTWMDESFGPRIISGKRYQVKFTYKTTNIAGPRNSGSPYGLVIKVGDAVWNNPTMDQFETSYRNSSQIVSHITTNDDWKTVTSTFTAPASKENIYVYLDNVTSGQSYIDEFSMREILSDGSLGGEVIRNPKADQHTYFEQRPSAYIDFQLTQGEQNGVTFKYVVHDKNDWIQNHLLSSGQWSDTGDGYYQDENTKARWLLRQWYRYIAARWGYSTAVHSWELNNEGPPNAESPGTSAHWRTAQSFAKYMHDTDANKHLATTSFWCCWRPEFFSNNSLFPDIDYADLHMYTNNMEAGTVPDGTNDLAMWTYNTSIYAYNNNKTYNTSANPRGVGKPIMRAETGTADPNLLSIANPGVWYHNFLWAQLNYGAMSDPNWWFTQNFSYINQLQISKAFYQFIKDLDLNKGGYIDSAASSSNTKLRLIGQKNISKNKAHLWVQNSDHTWKNVQNNISSTQNGTVTIRMNPNINYSVQTWDTSLGSVKSTQSLTSNSSGDLLINISPLADDLALKIFSNSQTTAPTSSPTNAPTATPSPTPTPTAPPIIPTQGNGDANNDGQVNNQDLTFVLGKYTQSLTDKTDQYVDGKINMFDFVHINKILTAPTPTPTPTSVPTQVPTAVPTTPSQTVSPQPTSQATTEWTQFGQNAQRTNYTLQTVSTPWKYKWQWNGAGADGKKQAGHLDSPDLVQPITGGGRVYMVAGNTVVALNKTNGSVIWQKNNLGTLATTPAYLSESVFVASSNNTLYKLDASTGNQQATFVADSALNLNPTISSNFLYIVSTNGTLYKIDTATLSKTWSYSAGAIGATMPSISSNKNLAIYVSRDLYVHAVNLADGTRKWRVKPTSRTYTVADPTNNLTEAENGWPVIAEQNGVVFIRYRLEWQTLWNGPDTQGTFPSTNDAIRAFLTNSPKDQALFALKLDDGATAFIPNAGNGGAGDGGYLPMGTLPIVRNLNGTELAYVTWRNKLTCASESWCDSREDATMGEMVLNSSTIPGYLPGYMRFVMWRNAQNSSSTYHDMQTDEMMQINGAGATLFHNHWLAAESYTITDRANSLGDTYANAIKTTSAPNIIWRQVFCEPTNTNCNPQIFPGGTGYSWGPSSCQFNSTSRYCTQLYGYGDQRGYPAGFYEYHNDYNPNANSTPFTVVSDNLVLIKTNDGAVIALESGTPQANANTEQLKKLAASYSNSQVLGAQTLPIINFKDAKKYVGKRITAQGVIQSVVNRSPKAVYLGFKSPHDGELLVRVFDKDISKFKYDLKTLKGKKVQVTGFVTLYWPESKDPEIIVTDPNQIEIK